MTRNLQRLGNTFQISLPRDSDGYLGRECPDKDCEKYFKIKPGTGLPGKDLPVHCPYCGHVGPMDHFHTKSQIEYGKSVMMQQLHEAVVRDMEDMADDFNRRTSGGLIGITMDVTSSPSSLQHYTEQELETNVECSNCTLQYSVFGVFAFCPDCAQHNSLQILDKNLDVIGKMLTLATSPDKELADKLMENALEDCVSAFDGFGRELCRVFANKSTNQRKAKKISFQNLQGATANVAKWFGIDLSTCVTLPEWTAALRGFQKRHLFAHKMGVVDEEYMTKTGDPGAIVGRKVSVDPNDVCAVVKAVRKIAQHLSDSFGK